MQKQKEYIRTMINTASPGKIVLMLYDGVIKNLRMMKKSCEEKKFEEKDQYFDKSIKIILELLGALNEEKGGEIARNLKSLYTYMIRRLNEATVKNDPRLIDEVLGYLVDLREAWQVAVKAEA